MREQAQRTLEDAYKANAGQYILMLAKELAKDTQASEIRQAAGLSAKNALVAKSDAKREELHAQWVQIDEPTKESIRAAVMPRQ